MKRKTLESLSSFPQRGFFYSDKRKLDDAIDARLEQMSPCLPESFVLDTHKYNTKDPFKQRRWEHVRKQRQASRDDSRIIKFVINGQLKCFYICDLWRNKKYQQKVRELLTWEQKERLDRWLDSYSKECGVYRNGAEEAVLGETLHVDDLEESLDLAARRSEAVDFFQTWANEFVRLQEEEVERGKAEAEARLARARLMHRALIYIPRLFMQGVLKTTDMVPILNYLRRKLAYSNCVNYTACDEEEGDPCDCVLDFYGECIDPADLVKIPLRDGRNHCFSLKQLNAFFESKGGQAQNPLTRENLNSDKLFLYEDVYVNMIFLFSYLRFLLWAHLNWRGYQPT